MELSQNERCEYMHVHEDIVAKVEKEMPDDEILFDLAELFKYRDSTRSKFCICCLNRDVRV